MGAETCTVYAVNKGEMFDIFKSYNSRDPSRDIAYDKEGAEPHETVTLKCKATDGDFCQVKADVCPNDRYATVFKDVACGETETWSC
eukprot:CAMPEP_0183308128 /NCGR_PEP_ID=MMETSP0160_2-20130417/19977_1 /TAXON_ID=2839 ORGANISM="Odontella Sinensis, Strain Grunow 1884" /NCGR_SAMPLE_ID=MMETSP0160_2 /ASSEMBLY_ACC=CAM_ASM_000250 /LENGTH=86 /DNA_ID=CAMNT_0025471887 /DNA_START=75 /DNA_END=335 /DNA_ORIENTATION=+